MCSPTLVLAAGVSIYSGYQQAKNSKRQASLYERQAALTRQQGKYNATRAQDRAKQVIAKQRGAFLANGIAVDTGSASAVIEDTTTETELDIAAIRYGADIESTNLAYAASNQRANARSQIQGGYINALAPTINSKRTATVLNGAF